MGFIKLKEGGMEMILEDAKAVRLLRFIVSKVDELETIFEDDTVGASTAPEEEQV